MNQRSFLAFVFLPFALGACSSEEATGNSPGSTSQASTCAASLPKAISISEGGRFVLARKDRIAQEDVTFAGRGVAVHAASDAVAIRAPYVGESEGELAVDVRCGDADPVAIPIALKPLAWTRLAEWTDEGPPGREYGGWWIDPSGGLVV